MGWNRSVILVFYWHFRSFPPSESRQSLWGNQTRNARKIWVKFTSSCNWANHHDNNLWERKCAKRRVKKWYSQKCLPLLHFIPLKINVWKSTQNWFVGVKRKNRGEKNHWAKKLEKKIEKLVKKESTVFGRQQFLCPCNEQMHTVHCATPFPPKLEQPTPFVAYNSSNRSAYCISKKKFFFLLSFSSFSPHFFSENYSHFFFNYRFSFIPLCYHLR